MALSKRQETARDLARSLAQRGATVTNVLPLADDQNLRFWVSDYKKGEVLTALADAGYEPIFTGMNPQFCTASYSMGLVNNFELALERERQPVANDRITGEIFNPEENKKSEMQIAAMRKHLGWDK
jgi:hypothetical protein